MPILITQNNFLEIQIPGGELLLFERMELAFNAPPIANIFGNYEAHTLLESLEHPRLHSYADCAHQRYAQYLDLSLGQFLINLKNNQDDWYKKFLNEYGDEDFCNFSLPQAKIRKQKGLYLFATDRVRYIGRCTDSFHIRININYGNISPVNCLKTGQATNTKINSLVNKEIMGGNDLSFWICCLENVEQIKEFEKRLINSYWLEWNSRQ